MMIVMMMIMVFFMMWCILFILCFIMFGWNVIMCCLKLIGRVDWV